MADVKDGLMAYVKFFAESMAEMGGPKGSASMYSILLKHGTPKVGSPWPSGLKRGRMKMCFKNAQMIALFDDRYTYCEGLAQNMIATLHGWLEDADGNVIDPTWKNAPACAYLGVRFKTEYVRESVVRTRLWTSLLDNYEERWPLLSGATPLESALHL
jgi:hypothetical protein